MRRGRAAAFLACFVCLADARAVAETATDPGLEHALDRIRSEPRSPDGFADLAGWLFRHGDLARARAAADEAARLDPRDALLQRLLGYLAAAAGDDAGAEAALQRAAALDPATRGSLADFHLARAWAGYQEALRREGADPLLLLRLREIGAVAEIAPELKSLVRGGLPDSLSPARERVPPIHLGNAGDTAVVVEKRSQTVRLYGRVDGGLALLKTYPCTTGQAAGAKQERGDRKTPDGVYFVYDLLPGEKLPNQYGALALPLDYPNAWDRRAGRDGYGIWFHGSDRLGSPFTPRDTQGCVIMRNDDLLELAGWVGPRTTPVLIAEEVRERPLLEWQAEVAQVLYRAGADAATSVVAAPEYALLLDRREGVARMRFLPRTSSDPRREAPSGVRRSPPLWIDDQATPPSADVWQQKVQLVRPLDVATLAAIDVAGDRIVIETSAPIRARLFRAELGARAYVDLAGVRSSPVPETREGSGPIRRVRISAAATDPPLTRLAIDLEGDATPRLESDGSRLAIVLDRDSGDPALSGAPATAAGATP